MARTGTATVAKFSRKCHHNGLKNGETYKLTIFYDFEKYKKVLTKSENEHALKTGVRKQNNKLKSNSNERSVIAKRKVNKERTK